jgi:hypothetical protein
MWVNMFMIQNFKLMTFIIQFGRHCRIISKKGLRSLLMEAPAMKKSLSFGGSANSEKALIEDSSLIEIEEPG